MPIRSHVDLAKAARELDFSDPYFPEWRVIMAKELKGANANRLCEFLHVPLGISARQWGPHDL
jgi:hypothetical protein